MGPAAMANEVLERVADQERVSRGDACLVRALGWGPWAGGMVTPELARAFHRICWIPFGQTPNLPDLQRALFRQLSGGKELNLPAEERTEKDPALKALRAAAKGQRVLVILDDIWLSEPCCG